MGVGRTLLDAGRALLDARVTYRRYGAITGARVQAAVEKEIAHLVVLRGTLQRMFGARISEKTHPDLVFPIRVKGAILCVPVKTGRGFVLIQFAHTDFKLTEDLRDLIVFDHLPTVVVFRESDMRHLNNLSLGQQRKLLEDPVGYITDHAVFIITPSTVFGRTEHRPMLETPDVYPRTFRYEDFTSPGFQRNIAPHIQPHTLMQIEGLIHG